eukprot:c11656_g1_i1.p1 GENE.c11656_g1_i1~~c11656_g1_i1.p1  ORF type:complete len:197 (-),score=-0.98 c11656_g1_i1:318-908(-)
MSETIIVKMSEPAIPTSERTTTTSRLATTLSESSTTMSEKPIFYFEHILFGIVLILATVAIILANYAENRKFITWWVTIPTFPTTLIWFIASFNYKSGCFQHGSLFRLMLVSCFTLLLGILVDARLYKQSKDQICYRFNGDSRLVNKTNDEYDVPDLCCDENPQPTDQCFYPVLNESNMCICCFTTPSNRSGPGRR